MKIGRRTKGWGSAGDDCDSSDAGGSKKRCRSDGGLCTSEGSESAGDDCGSSDAGDSKKRCRIGGGLCTSEGWVSADDDCGSCGSRALAIVAGGACLNGADANCPLCVV